MKEDIKQRWVEALRSGKYKQGPGQLAQNTSGEWTFCCLGVLCDLAEQDGVVGHTDDGLIRTYGQVAPPGDNDPRPYSQTTTPTVVKKWAGLEDHNPAVRFNDEWRTLAGLNDEGFGFDAIAEFIEVNL